jgi:hypothetical protein
MARLAVLVPAEARHEHHGRGQDGATLRRHAVAHISTTPDDPVQLWKQRHPFDPAAR